MPVYKPAGFTSHIGLGFVRVVPDSSVSTVNLEVQGNVNGGAQTGTLEKTATNSKRTYTLLAEHITGSTMDYKIDGESGETLMFPQTTSVQLNSTSQTINAGIGGTITTSPTTVPGVPVWHTDPTSNISGVIAGATAHEECTQNGQISYQEQQLESR